MNRNPEPRRTLADLIMEKITEKGTEMKTQFTEEGSVNRVPEIEPRVKVPFCEILIQGEVKKLMCNTT